MREIVRLEDKGEVEAHILTEFGDIQRCRSCGMIMPPADTVIEVIKEPLQTCHRRSGYNLDKDNCIPVGVYRTGVLEASSHASH